jgi:predicted transcriptional regulator
MNFFLFNYSMNSERQQLERQRMALERQLTIGEEQQGITQRLKEIATEAGKGKSKFPELQEESRVLSIRLEELAEEQAREFNAAARTLTGPGKEIGSIALTTAANMQRTHAKTLRKNRLLQERKRGSVVNTPVLLPKTVAPVNPTLVLPKTVAPVNPTLVLPKTKNKTVRKPIRNFAVRCYNRFCSFFKINTRRTNRVAPEPAPIIRRKTAEVNAYLENLKKMNELKKKAELLTAPVPLQKQLNKILRK